MKSNFKKKALLLSLSLAFVGVGGAAVATQVSSADGETTATFEMLDGAAIGFFDDNVTGIKFVADVGTPVSGATYHMMIVPQDYVDDLGIVKGEDFYKEIYDALNAKGLADTLAVMTCNPVQNATYGSSWYVQGTLTGIKYKNINQKWFGIAYYTDESGVNTYAGGGEGLTRDVVYVASKLMTQGKNADKKALLQDYVDQGVNYVNGVAVEDSKTDVTIEAALNKTSVNLVVGGGETLTVSGMPAGVNVYTEWDSSNKDVATVENGVLTAAGIGTANVTFKFLDKTLTCEVNVLEVEDKTTIALDFNKDIEYPTFEKEMSGTAQVGYIVTKYAEATVNEFSLETVDVKNELSALGTVSAVYDSADLSNNLYNGENVDLTKVAYGERNLIVCGENKAWKISATVISKVISTDEQLLAWRDVYTNVWGAIGAAHGEYFVLGADIAGTGTFASGVNSKWPNPQTIAKRALATDDTIVAPAVGRGFQSTFDGRGFEISGYSYGVGGMFGALANATIKNLNIVNATLLAKSTNSYYGSGAQQEGYSSVIAQSMYKSKMENCYIDYTMVDGTDHNSMIYMTVGASFKNVVVTGNMNSGSYNSNLIRAAYFVDVAKGHTADYNIPSTFENVRLVNQGTVERLIYERGASDATYGTTYDGLKSIHLSGEDNAIIYTDDSMGDTTSLTLTANNAGSENITWNTSNAYVATVDNGVVEAVAEGEAQIWFSFVFNGYTISTPKKTVKVASPAQESGVTMSFDTNYKATTSFAFANSALGTVAEVYDINNLGQNIYSDGNVDITNVGYGKQTLVVKNTEGTRYKVSVVVITKTILTHDELVTAYTNYFNVAYNNVNKINGQYYRLGANITAPTDGYTFAAGRNSIYPDMTTMASRATSGYGFQGTFDGDGYALTNYKFGQGGLLGDVANATIKNLAIKNAVLAAVTNGSTSLIGTSMYNTNVENCYFEYTMPTSTSVSGQYHSAGVAIMAVGGSVRNTVLACTNTPSSNRFNNALFKHYHDKTDASKVCLTTNLDNVLVLHKGTDKTLIYDYQYYNNGNSPILSLDGVETVDTLASGYDASNVTYTTFDVSKLDGTYFTKTANAVPTWIEKTNA